MSRPPSAQPPNRQHAALSVLTELTVEVQARLALDELLQLIVECAAKILDTPRATVRLLDESGTKLLAVCRAGSPLHENPDESFKVGEGLLGWIVAERQALRSGRAQEDARFAARPGMKESLGSFVGVPLITGNRCLGVIGASSPSLDRFDERDVETLTLLAGISAPYVEIARLTRVAAELEDVVVRDGLTGLFNHAYFQDHLEAELRRSARHELPCSIVILDIDSFAVVNEARGHHAGDSLLEGIAEILAGRGQPEVFRLRAEDVCARFGGDEFALILPNTPKAGAARKAELLRDHVEGYDFHRIELPPQTLSIGVAAYPEDADDRAGLLTAAHRALRAAKAGGRNAVIAYGAELDEPGEPDSNRGDSSRGIEVERFIALRNLIDGRAVGCVFQPIVDVRRREVMAYEALCRPIHEDFSGPAELFAIAERAGRVVDLGRICRAAAVGVIDQLPEGCMLFVNLHAHEVHDRRLLERDGDLGRWADRIVLEVTETAEIGDYDRLRRVIRRLRELGFRIALDDLGAGYAGLNSLASLEPDFVKLDMSLVRRVRTQPGAARLVKHILEYCEEEGVQVVAEGIETEAEWKAVTDLGVPLVQGYYLARPGPPYPVVAATLRSHPRN